MNIHDLDALLVGTPEFRFCPNASTLAEAQQKGFRDFGNILKAKCTGKSSSIDHYGGYRGRKVKDYQANIKIDEFSYMLAMDEFKRENLFYRVFGIAGTPDVLTQAQGTNVVMDLLPFSSTNIAAPNNWYGFTYTPPTPGAQPQSIRFIQGGYVVQRISQVAVPGVAATGSVTINTLPADGDTVTISDGTNVKTFEFDNNSSVTVGNISVTIGGTINATAAALNTAIMAAASLDVSSTASLNVVSLTNDTIGIAGNVPVAFTGLALSATGMSGGVNTIAIGTPVTLIEGLDYELDLANGSIRFYAAQTSPVRLTASWPEVTSTSPLALNVTIPKQKSLFRGIGWLMIWDQNDRQNLVFEHRGFGCTVMADGDTEFAEDNAFSEMSLKVEVLAPVAEIYTRR